MNNYIYALTDAEMIYKCLYFKNTEIYNEPVTNWDDFVQRYHKKLPSEKLPTASPTQMMEFFEESDPFVKNTVVSVVRHSRYCPGFWNKLEFVKMVYVLRGSAVVMIENKRIEMKQGSFCITAPRVNTSTFACHDEDIVINILIRNSSFMSAFSSLLAEQGVIPEFFWSMLYSKDGNRSLVFKCDSDKMLDKIIVDICREYSQTEKPSNLMLKSYVMLFFAYVLRNHQQDLETEASINGIKNSTISQVLGFMRANMTEVTLTQVAQELHLSEAHTSRIIKKYTGCTFSYLLRDMRLKRAADMLKNTSATVEEIAETIGYSDASRFYKNFKDTFGLTPDAYRKHI